MIWLTEAPRFLHKKRQIETHLSYDSQQLEVVKLHFHVLQAQALAPLLTLLHRVAKHFELAEERVEDAEGQGRKRAVIVGISARGDAALHYVDHAFAQRGLRRQLSTAMTQNEWAGAHKPGLNQNSTGIRSS